MSERKAVTIQDIAAQVGVSKMTVSNVLSGNHARRRHVSEETRRRVLEAARQMQYRPNALARSLRSRRTNVIGLYSGYGYLSPENAFYSALISGIQRGCDAHRKDLLLHGIFRGRSVQDIYAELADGRIDGLILHAPPNDPLINLLAKSSLPVITIADAVPDSPSVMVDDAAGSRMIAAHIAAQGHRRIIYLSHTARLDSVLRRLEAFHEAAMCLGLDVEERPVANEPRSVFVSDTEACWLDRLATERATAAVCWSDMAAYDLLDHCHRRGMRVPEDLAIAGFDGVFPTRGMSRRLTTVRAPWADVGQTAAALLVQAIAGEPIPQETVLPVEFVGGDTV